MTLKDKNLYYVGGVVRDEILGTKSFDVDFCYEGDAIKYAENQGFNIVKKNPAFGTVRILIDGKEIDIASTREETYPKPGHLPVVKNIGCPLVNDLKRRDFTVNAMAKNTLTGEIVDYYGGYKDIKDKKLKVLHDNSFIEDPSRILRGLKFSVRFDFELDEHTKNLQDMYLENVNYDMSNHRIRKELLETFNLNKGIAFDKFIEQKIYRLLTKESEPLNIDGKLIQKYVDEFKIGEPFIVYYAFFNIKNPAIALTRHEKRVLEWVDKLKTKNSGNNTPVESVVISKIIKEGLC